MIKQRMMAMLPRIFAIVAVVVILGAAVGAGSALAAKGGNGNGKALGLGNGNGNGSTTAVLTVAPDPAFAGSSVTVTGSGFKAGESLLVGIPGDLRFTSVTADKTGAFSFVYTARNLAPGYTYSMEAWGKGKGKTWVLRASTSFTVVP